MENTNQNSGQDFLWPPSQPIIEDENIENKQEDKKPEPLAGINPEAMQEILQKNHGPQIEENINEEPELFSDPATREQRGKGDDKNGMDSRFHGNDNVEESAELDNNESTEEIFSNTPPVEAKKDTEKDADKNTEIITISKTKFLLLQKLVQNIKENTQRVEDLLASDLVDNEDSMKFKISTNVKTTFEEDEEESKVLEGVFDGTHMIGPDGKQYTIPVNYASKSKLVEGDILKLTILANGRFIYKQIGPIERTRIIGKIIKESNDYYATDNSKRWKILTASVTYFKGQLDDEIIILVPKHGESAWAAVENIVSQS
ncbi:MAG: hypothetical protein ABIH48_02390 [Candidatus Falkowbacteria bacterium]